MRRCGRRLSRRYLLVNSRFMDRMLRIACRHSDRVLCLNRGELLWVAEKGWAAAPAIQLFRNGAAEQFFKVERDYDRHPVTLLFVGQWDERKGIRYLVQSFTKLVGHRAQLHLVCAGTLRDEPTTLGDFPAHVRNRVTVRPRVSRAELIELHSIADIFVFPTLFEGSSLALLEAMASGMPIVTTPVGSAPDILHDQTSALFVPPANATSLAGAIQKLLDDHGMRSSLGRNARFAAQEYRAVTAVAHNLSQLECLVRDDSYPQFAHDPVSIAPVRN
jgi:glycosyltransferase involved in cell wall biosynthesis